jgi:hypothetical protein
MTAEGEEVGVAVGHGEAEQFGPQSGEYFLGPVPGRGPSVLRGAA